MARTEYELLPQFTAELDEIRKNGITIPLLVDIIQKHTPNSEFNKNLYKRYLGISGSIPIDNRTPHYEGQENAANNKVSNDFMGEIVDFKVGYFAGEPISYSYSNTDEAEEVTGGEKSVEEVQKKLTDFIVRNNMYGVDMETTKNATIYGYSGRLFYIKDGEVRVTAIHGYETIILSDTDISEPEYAIRYYKAYNSNKTEKWIVEFYDNRNVTIYEGSSLIDLAQKDIKEHLFDFCPLQGVANNKECMGDAEKVLPLIDDYDKVVSDNSNEIENFVHALMVASLVGSDVEETLQKANQSGILNIPPVGTNQISEPVKWVTKNINDTFTEHHLQRLEDNIYRFSRTPNLNDDTFGNASGVSLKFKLHGLETKCASFEASAMNSAQYMWKLLCSVWNKKGTKADPLQFVMEFNRNFPLDRLSEANTAQAFISAGLPKKWVYSQIAGIDDVQYILDLLEKEQNDVTSMYNDNEINGQINDDNKQINDKATDEELDETTGEIVEEKPTK